MKWFMSYVRVSFDGALTFGHTVSKSIDGHPVATINRWNKDYGEKEKSKHILLSFQQVGEECPDADEMGHIHF